MIYVDASVLIELYLERANWQSAREILLRPEAKASSMLLLAEVPVALRHILSGRGAARALEQALARFDRDLAKITLSDSMTDVARRIRSDSRFARCRALDAVHACTALLLSEWSGRPVRLETFDTRLAGLASELGLR